MINLRKNFENIWIQFKLNGSNVNQLQWDYNLSPNEAKLVLELAKMMCERNTKIQALEEQIKGEM